MQTAKVIEPQGLILRDAPSTKGKQLALMKEKEEVVVLNDNGPEETLFGRKSRWFEVVYKNKKGWAFGGFLEYNRQINTTQSTNASQLNTFTNSIGMEFVLIPSGEFMMGCVDGDKDCKSEEKPQHKVRITKSFYMGKYEVTQGQWKKVMGDNPSKFKNCGDNCPVDFVSWNQVQEFIKKLNSREKRSYRLPTEAEWEYAARGGTNTIYYWGSENKGDYAWYTENSENKTHPVGQKKPNSFGLYDMIGNVWEWVEDRFHQNYYANSPLSDPDGSPVGANRILRGSSWGGGHWSPHNITDRTSYRFYHEPNLRNEGIGFRLVLPIE